MNAPGLPFELGVQSAGRERDCVSDAQRSPLFWEVGRERQGTRAAPWASVLLEGAQGRWTPSAVPWGLGPGRTASPPVCKCGPASLSLGGGCALRLDASGVARALGLVSSLTPLSLGPAGGTVYFILLFFLGGREGCHPRRDLRSTTLIAAGFPEG